MLKKDNIRITIDNLREHHRQRHDATMDTITAALFADREAAREAKQFGASISALKIIATMHGLITNKQQVDLKTSVQLSDIELGAKLAGLLSLAEARKRQAEASKQV